MTLRERVLLLAAGGAAVYTLLRQLRKQDAALTQVHQNQEQLLAELIEQSRYVSQQNQSLIWLYSQLDFTAPLPGMRGWAISPDYAALLVELLRRYQPETVLEFGGGTSTIIAAKTLQQLGRGSVIAVEAIERFVHSTRADLKRHDLEGIATVVHAPLTRVEINGRAWMWYDKQAFYDVDDVNFLIVDGPAQYDNPRRMARYPALPCMENTLTDDAIILMDDTNREDERMIAARWLEEFPQYRRLAEYEYFEKGALVLARQ